MLDKEIIDKDFIEKLIPQKAPFVMIDKLLLFEKDKVISGLTITSENIMCNETHFTEGGLIENMAQSIALHRGYRSFIKKGGDSKPRTGFIGSIKYATIEKLPEIGSKIQTTVEIVAEIMQVSLVKITVHDEQNSMIATAEMKTIIVDKR